MLNGFSQALRAYLTLLAWLTDAQRWGFIIIMFVQSSIPYGISQTVTANKLLTAICWQSFLSQIIYSSGILMCSNGQDSHKSSCPMMLIQIIVKRCHQSYAQMLTEMPWNYSMCACLSVKKLYFKGLNIQSNYNFAKHVCSNSMQFIHFDTGQI